MSFPSCTDPNWHWLHVVAGSHVNTRLPENTNPDSGRQSSFANDRRLLPSEEALIETLSENCQVSQMQRRSATTRYPEAVRPNGLAPNDRIFTFQDFAGFFAELSAEKAPIAPLEPLYSVENKRTPAASNRLLTDRL